MLPDPCLIYPDTIVLPDTIVYPWGICATPPLNYGPGGGGHGALMSREHFERYEVAGKWRGVKRVKISTRGQK